MSADPRVQLVLDCHTDLGESPVWDERTGRLYFVDINEKKIHVFTPENKEHFTIDAPVSSSLIPVPCQPSESEAFERTQRPPATLARCNVCDAGITTMLTTDLVLIAVYCGMRSAYK